MVRMVGIEPTLRNRNWILSPTRLPIPPHSHVFLTLLIKAIKGIFCVNLKAYALNLDGNYSHLILYCQVFYEDFGIIFKI